MKQFVSQLDFASTNIKKCSYLDWRLELEARIFYFYRKTSTREAQYKKTNKYVYLKRPTLNISKILARDTSFI